MRFIAVSTLGLALYSAGSAAECNKPALPDLNTEAQIESTYAFQSRVYEFIACQRDSLGRRAGGLARPDVRQLILQDRASEDRVLAEMESLFSCFSHARREPDPQIALAKCNEHIQSAMDERRLPDSLHYRELTTNQRSAHGGIWSYRTLDFGRPGRCMDGPCDNMLGVEVTNMTPVVLTCAVTLKASNQRGEQMITLYPGDSVPAARVTFFESPTDIEPEVTCAPAEPVTTASPTPADCNVNWVPRAVDFPIGLSRSAWESGTALLEFAVPRNYKPPEDVRVIHADSPRIGQAASSVLGKLAPFTNCPGQRFRARIEYRAFPCYECSRRHGVVTLLTAAP